MRGLTGRSILMAGGAGGIGSATSLRLGQEGARVAVGDLNREAAEAVATEIAGAGGTAIAFGLDVGDEASVAAAIERTLEAHGRLDAVHVNAADFSPDAVGKDTDALTIDLAAFDKTMHTDVRGHLLVTQLALPHLLEGDGGVLVYTSSAAAFIGEKERPSYAIAKAGINALVRHVASKWGKKGIRANAIAPGLVLHERLQETLDPDFRAMALRGSRSPRLGRPSDIAALVAFLMSDDGEWINGQVISVDGGATMR